MGEAARSGGSPVGTANGERSPEEIRSDIRRTREELGDTVEALAAKTDVKAQAQVKADEVKARVRQNPQKPAAIAGGIVLLLVALAVLRRRRLED